MEAHKLAVLEQLLIMCGCTRVTNRNLPHGSETPNIETRETQSTTILAYMIGVSVRGIGRAVRESCEGGCKEHKKSS